MGFRKHRKEVEEDETHIAMETIGDEKPTGEKLSPKEEEAKEDVKGSMKDYFVGHRIDMCGRDYADANSVSLLMLNLSTGYYYQSALQLRQVQVQHCRSCSSSWVRFRCLGSEIILTWTGRIVNNLSSFSTPGQPQTGEQFYQQQSQNAYVRHSISNAFGD